MVLVNKKCTHCGQAKRVDQFAKRRSGSVASWCKACTRVATRLSVEKNKGDVAMLKREVVFWKMRAQKLSAQLEDLGKTPNYDEVVR